MVSGTDRRDDERAKVLLLKWMRRLRIGIPVRTERTSIWQVVGESGRAGCSLVGVVFDERTGCIYHTRRLKEEDIVHELLHVAHPDWSEASVVAETDRLLSRAQHGHRVGVLEYRSVGVLA